MKLEQPKMEPDTITRTSEDTEDWPCPSPQIGPVEEEDESREKRYDIWEEESCLLTMIQALQVDVKVLKTTIKEITTETLQSKIVSASAFEVRERAARAFLKNNQDKEARFGAELLPELILTGQPPAPVGNCIVSIFDYTWCDWLFLTV